MKAYKGYLIAIAVTLLVTLGGVGAYASSQNQKEYGVFTPFPKTTVKTETKTEIVPFTEKRNDDSNLEKGKLEVRREGTNGSRAITYQVTRKGKKEVSRKVTKNEVTTPPLNRMVAVGTYVAPAVASTPARNSGGGGSSRPAYIPGPTTTLTPPRAPTFCTFGPNSIFCT